MDLSNNLDYLCHVLLTDISTYTKNMENTHKRNTIDAARVLETADICDVSPRHVRRVISGESENEQILKVYMELLEGGQKLREAVRKLIPF